MSEAEDATCSCVSEHRPPVLSFEHHHIWPQGMGGLTVEENLVWICPSTHTNTHEILRLMVKNHRYMPWEEIVEHFKVPVSRYAYRLALLGYRRWINHALSAS